jgi:hypothetical protein
MVVEMVDANFEHRMTHVEARVDELEKRQDNLDDLIGTVKVLADREERVEDDVKEIKADVKELANKPAKRWDNLVSQIITLVVAAIVGFLLAKIGL